MDHRLEVDRNHLIQGLGTVGGRSSKLHKSGRATLGFDGSYLTVEAGYVTFIARATGVWPGNAIVGMTMVQALASKPPDGDPIVVACDGTHVRFGPLKVACRWQSVSGAILAQPSRPEWIEALSLKYQVPRGRLFAEGRIGEIQAAEQKLATLLRKIAKPLAPMGVTVGDLEALVERRMAERHAGGDVGC